MSEVETVDFTVGTKAVAHDGPGTIVSINAMEVHGQVQRFFVFKPHRPAVVPQLYVPEAQANVLLRPLIDEAGIAQVMRILESAPTADSHSAWNRQYERWHAQVKGVDFRTREGVVTSQCDRAEALVGLTHKKSERELTFAERSLLVEARQRIVDEIAFATGRHEAEVDVEVERALMKSLGH